MWSQALRHRPVRPTPSPSNWTLFAYATDAQPRPASSWCLLNVQTVIMRTCFFLMPAERTDGHFADLLLLDACWTYRRSLCGFLCEDTVKTFSSVNQIKFTLSSGNICSSFLAHCRRTARFDQVSCCTRRFFTHCRLRSSWTMRSMDDFGTQISLEIWRMERCVCGCPSWLRTCSSTDDTLSSVRADLGLPLPFFRSVVPVSRCFFRRFSNPHLFQFFSGILQAHSFSTNTNFLWALYPHHWTPFLMVLAVSFTICLHMSSATYKEYLTRIRNLSNK